MFLCISDTIFFEILVHLNTLQNTFIKITFEVILQKKLGTLSKKKKLIILIRTMSS